MDFRSELLALVEGYASAKRISEARVANLAGRDGHFFARLRGEKRGRRGGELGCTASTLEALRRWFSANWPADVPWPAGIPRVPVEAPARPAPRHDPGAAQCG